MQSNFSLDLQNQIIKLKEKLNNAYEKEKEINGELVKLSQLLDELILAYMIEKSN